MTRSLGVGVAAALAVASGCATINSGAYGVPVDTANRPTAGGPRPTLRISASEVPSLSSPYFGLIEVTFENDAAAWEQIDRLTLDFGSPERNRSVQIPWGDDIVLWHDAVAYRNAVRTVNEQTALATLALVGAVGSAVGGHGRGAGAAVAAVGGLLEVASLGAAVAVRNEAPAEGAAATAQFSGAHLLAMPIRVPPGLFTKRWILLYTAARPLGGCIDWVTLAYETANHTQGRVLLRYKRAGSEWQPQSCDLYRPGAFQEQ